MYKKMLEDAKKFFQTSASLQAGWVDRIHTQIHGILYTVRPIVLYQKHYINGFNRLILSEMNLVRVETSYKRSQSLTSMLKR